MKYRAVAMIGGAFLVGNATAPTPLSSVDDAGTLRLSNGDVVPYSDLASPQARRNFVATVRGYEALLARPAEWKSREGESAAAAERRWYDETAYIPWLKRLRRRFGVEVEPMRIAGVQTDIVTPAGGVAPENRHRVLINLHGGGMIVGGRYGGQLESIPIASIGRIKVVTIDYRMAPEHRYPAAEQDVIAVFRELLKTYRPDSVGIYGCSSGSVLTATSVARLIASGQSGPGAIGMFGEGPLGGNAHGDSNHIFSGGKPIIPPERDDDPANYFAGVNMADRIAFPVGAVEVQRRFPPSLLITGTRDMSLSRTAYTHSQLVAQGVNAELHIWEGAPHCSFAQPFVDPEVPENWQAWRVITRFFDRNLKR